MTEQPYEIKPRVPKETIESIVKVGDLAQDAETDELISIT